MAVTREDMQNSCESLKECINTREEAKYQRVSDVVLLDNFPRNVAGKILINKLKELYRGH